MIPRGSELLLASAAVMGTAALGSYFTAMNTQTPWYRCIKPAFTPPPYVFPVVWTVLYVCIAIAFSRSFTNSRLRRLFVANLVLNVVWCYLYFGIKQPVPAFAAILLLGWTIIVIVHHSKDQLTRTLMLCYLAWIAFASILNGASLFRLKACARK
jgi:translocator protein